MVACSGRRRNDVELWQKLTRSAFREFLRTRFLGRNKRQWSKPSKGTESKDALTLFAGEKDGLATLGTNSSDTIIDDKKQFRLPWIPEKSVVAQMMAVMGLAKAIPSEGALLSMCEPSSLTEIRPRGFDDSNADIVIALGDAIKHWVGYENGNELPVIAVKGVPEPSRYGSRSGKDHSDFLSNIEVQLCEGEAVFVVSSDEGLLGKRFADLSIRTLQLPPLCQAGMIELIRALHAPSKRASDKFLRKSLPDDKLMAKLSSVVIESALRQRTTAAMIARLAYATKPQVQTSLVTLDDVHGQDAAVSAFRQMLEDMERWRAGEVDWADLVMSAVMYGPPGNGKTMLATAVAASAGVRCIATSYSECQSFGHQGDMLKALKLAFQEAADDAPSVLFIDEIDSFSARDSDKTNDSYIRGVVNGLLTEISRAVRVPGLMLLAATNDLSVVDPAVIRPGRFDLRIPVLNPDLKGIKEILLHHLGVEELGHVDKDRLQEIVRQLAGTSGAGVAAIARQALGAARSAGRQVCLDDVITVASVDGKDEDRDSLYRCAIHESGHAMVRLWSALPNPTRVLLSATGGQVESRLPGLFTASTATEQMRCLLAGRAAEIVCLGDASSGSGVGHDSDLAVATSLALRIDSEWHLETSPTVWTSADLLMTVGMPAELRAKVAARLQHAEREAIEKIQAHKEAVLALAEHLMVVREMSGDELVRFVRLPKRVSVGPQA